MTRHNLMGPPGARARARATAQLGLLLGAAACTSLPKGATSVDSVDIEGASLVSASDLTDKLATTPTPKFLGLFRGIYYDYRIFDRTILQRDLERIERYYRARGFYLARVRAGRVFPKGEGHVAVQIVVEEGPPFRLEASHIQGTSSLPAEEARSVRLAERRALKIGDTFTEEAMDKATRGMIGALGDRGRAWARVVPQADVDLVRQKVVLTWTVAPGPLATIGAIRLEGLGDLSEAVVRRTLGLTEGEPYSNARLDSATEAVLGLGTFSSVEISRDLAAPPAGANTAVVPLRVSLALQKFKSVLLGGGVQLDSVRAQAHFRAGWEHRNFFGGFRNISAELKPTLDLYPTRLPTFEKPETALPGERFRATFRQPGLFEARTTGVVTQELNTFPVLLSSTVDPAAPVLGYLEYKASLGLDRTLWKTFGALHYDFQYNLPFAYTGVVDSSLRGISISSIGLTAHLDLRDNKMSPHKGLYVLTDVQIAGLGGHARDFRIAPEARGYIPLGRKVTLALRAGFGFLIPWNYGDAAKGARTNPTAVDELVWSRDLQLIYLRGFFSGGPSSNRGYPLRGVGPHGSVPFFNPGLEASAIANACVANSASYDPTRCSVPLGGLSLWEASVEVRFPLLGALSGSTFCDASDVSADKFDLRPYPHLSCGLGLRYHTPVGPIRVDLGYRIPGAQVPSSANLLVEGSPGTLFGLPIAVAFGIGEAF